MFPPPPPRAPEEFEHWVPEHSKNLCSVRELEEYHRWCEVSASWLALTDDYVNELHQAMMHDREIKQSEMLPARLFCYCNRVCRSLNEVWNW